MLRIASKDTIRPRQSCGTWCGGIRPDEIKWYYTVVSRKSRFKQCFSFVINDSENLI